MTEVYIAVEGKTWVYPCREEFVTLRPSARYRVNEIGNFVVAE